ncbi:MAG: hypothetical protein ACKVOE_05500 [Rickettsiales bacterium]
MIPSRHSPYEFASEKLGGSIRIDFLMPKSVDAYLEVKSNSSSALMAFTRDINRPHAYVPPHYWSPLWGDPPGTYSFLPPPEGEMFIGMKPRHKHRYDDYADHYTGEIQLPRMTVALNSMVAAGYMSEAQKAECITHLRTQREAKFDKYISNGDATEEEKTRNLARLDEEFASTDLVDDFRSAAHQRFGRDAYQSSIMTLGFAARKVGCKDAEQFCELLSQAASIYPRFPEIDRTNQVPSITLFAYQIEELRDVAATLGIELKPVKSKIAR